MDSVSEIISDINELRLTIKYCEGRILRKQIALQEILCSDPGNAEEQPQQPTEPQSAIAPAPPQPPATAFAPAPVSVNLAAPAVSNMMRIVLEEINGSTFDQKELRGRMTAKWPHCSDKITRGVYAIIPGFLAKGIIHRVPGGFRKGPPASTTIAA